MTISDTAQDNFDGYYVKEVAAAPGTNSCWRSGSGVGLGGRFGYRIHRRIMLEGELAYGYGINFNEAFHDIGNSNIAAIQRTSIAVTHGLLGPRLQPVRERGYRKGRIRGFRLSPSLLPPLARTLIGLRTSNLNFALHLAAAWSQLSAR
jgi:hypothetical protein